MYTIYTQKLKERGITEQVEFTPEQFEQFQEQYDNILEQEELANQVIIPEPIPVDPVMVYKNAVQTFLDKKAAEKGYDNILSAASYAGYTNDFQTEGIAFGTWRSACWKKCYEILAEIQAGTRAIPTPEDVIAELPLLPL